MKRMYKKISIALATIIMSISSISISVSALTEKAYINSEEYIAEYGLESEITTESQNKFYEYLGTLSEDEAKLILADEELVRFMQREAYWDTEGFETRAVTTRATRLPLINYPVGSYFSYDLKECSCHSNCTYDLSDGGYNLPTYRCYNKLTGTSGNCKRFDGGIQCAGFAYYVFHQYTGTHCSSTNQIDGLSSITATSAKDYFFKNITVGSHVRGTLKSGYPHSIIITGFTNNSVSYYQANVGGKCLVSTGTKTWTEFASWYSSISKSWVA